MYLTRISLRFNIVILFMIHCVALSLSTMLVENKKLNNPPLAEVANVLSNGLKDNFAEVTVEAVECPDLTVEPFFLASKGLGGSPRLVELGGAPYLLPTVNREKLYNLRNITELVGMKNAFIVGAGAGPHPYIGVNCEGIFNLNIVNGTVEQHSRISKVDVTTGNSIQEQLPNTETRCALLANLFYSEGKSGKVLKVHVKQRTGELDFVTSIRTALANHYKEAVGLGGAFLVKQGKVYQHVMPDFSKTPINNNIELNQWLKFYNMSSPLIALGTVISDDVEDLDLRVQHFHSFSKHGEAGHYHYDVTPETVEYLGYFNVAEYVYRIDKPKETHKFGRD